MNFNEVNQKVLGLIELNDQLADINYNDPRYDELEDKVYGLQDEANAAYGDYFDGVFKEIFKQLNSKDDILNFTDYIARSYMVSGEKNPDGSLKFDNVPEDCTLITIKPEALKGKRIEAKIYLKPNPLRIGFAIGEHERIVWNSETVQSAG
jgi:hypothetical protein